MPFGSKKKAKEENTGLAESAVVSVPKKFTRSNHSSTYSKISTKQQNKWY